MLDSLMSLLAFWYYKKLINWGKPVSMLCAPVVSKALEKKKKQEDSFCVFSTLLHFFRGDPTLSTAHAR